MVVGPDQWTPDQAVALEACIDRAQARVVYFDGPFWYDYASRVLLRSEGYLGAYRGVARCLRQAVGRVEEPGLVLVVTKEQFAP